jgi:hypothetical protein
MNRSGEAMMDRLHDMARDTTTLAASGPLPMSEADLLALEQQHDDMMAAAKRVRQHLTQCEKGDAAVLEAMDLLLKYIGIHDLVRES